MESTVNRSVSPLPEELTQVTDKDVPPEQVALKRTLQAQLKTASAQFPTAESPTGFLNAATPMAPLSSTVRTGKPNLPVRHAPPPFPLSPRPVVKPVAEVELPQPDLEEPPMAEIEETVVHSQEEAPVLFAEEQGQEEQGQEEQGQEEVLPVPVPQRPAPLRQPTPRDKYVCTVCGKPSQFRSQLKRHAEQQHPEMVVQILVPYPEQS
jgi:hypothetical protein